KNAKKTYNSRYSLVVTHLTTNPPVPCLSTAERTGSSVFSLLTDHMLVFSAVYGIRFLERKYALYRIQTSNRPQIQTFVNTEYNIQ
ncbi:hypothetical protein DM02DRAFT_543793, partial [Periconia macrospinosa]